MKVVRMFFFKNCLFGCACTARGGRSCRFRKITVKITAGRPAYSIVDRGASDPLAQGLIKENPEVILTCTYYELVQKDEH